MDGEQDDEELAIEYLKKHIDDLGPDIYAIPISDNSELISVSTNPEDDATMCPHYPPLQELQQLGIVQTVLRSEMQELDRLGPNVDLVSYKTNSLADKEVKPKFRNAVFKYYFHLQFYHQRWDEMNICMRLPPHPHIVPFDRLVIEELYGRKHVVGFTSLYIPGGTLDRIHENPNDNRVFKLKWLTQLTSLVDDLNLTYGIQHQDVAPRNLLVDETSDSIMLFDVNFSARIGGPLRGGDLVYRESRDDIKGVVFTLYEILTRDEHFRSIPHWNQNVSSVLDMKDWVQHPDIDYRAVLDKWLRTRKERGRLAVFTDATEYIDWPSMQGPSCFLDEITSLQGTCEDAQPSVYTTDQGDTSEEASRDVLDEDDPENQELEYDVDDCVAITTANTARPMWCVPRRKEWNNNRQVIEWERPAQAKIKEGACIFSDGKVIETSNETSTRELVEQSGIKLSAQAI
ncbi:CBL-interacting serine/threonine-protein kinase 20 [Cytospora mali]|uniref:non-specific serine/threonine protein kinase n=1 Tax=Cytospora mali TaxID=578113 RepID=A0A194W149_CYTMA|nr:CBL-interacting serine/threonine-protein kinase 20 [Valsa mali]